MFMANRDSFIFYKSFYDVLADLSKEDRLKLLDAIFMHQFNDKEIELTGTVKILLS